MVEYQGERVREFARKWPELPVAVRRALIVLRRFEEEGAYQPTLLADPVRGFFRQTGGADVVAESSVRHCPWLGE